MHLSTGDLLRKEIKAHTALGEKAVHLIKQGELLPDEDVDRLVEQYIRSAQPDHRGIMFDGYPRTMTQLEDLAVMLKDVGRELKFGISFDAGEDVLIGRLTARRVCENCGEVYNLVSRSPKTQGKCDVCGGKLYQRRDDTQEAIGHRLVDYERQTQPILARLDADGKLLRLDASQSVQDIHRRLVEMIEDL